METIEKNRQPRHDLVYILKLRLPGIRNGVKYLIYALL